MRSLYIYQGKALYDTLQFTFSSQIWISHYFLPPSQAIGALNPFLTRQECGEIPHSVEVGTKGAELEGQESWAFRHQPPGST